MKLLFITIFLLTSYQVKAADADSATLKSSDKDIEIQNLKARVKELEKMSDIQRKTSRENRQKKSISFDFGVASKFDGAGGLISAGYFITPSTLSYISWYGGDDNRSTITDRSRAVQLGAKLFAGNSFYFRFEGYYHWNEYEDSSISSQGQFYQVKYEDYGVASGIGNQWQYDWFSFGIDWIGFGLKLGESKEEENFTPDLFTAIFEPDEDFYLYLVNFYIGASF